jgi:phospholipase C
MQTRVARLKRLCRQFSSLAGLAAVLCNTAAPTFALAQGEIAHAPVEVNHGRDTATRTPIKHVIVIIGENRTFDHVFATYKPRHQGDKVLNLLSRHIVNEDGTPGPNYGLSLQYEAQDTDVYRMNPFKAPYSVLPPALTGGPATPAVCQAAGVTTGTSCVNPTTLALAKSVENGLPDDYYQYLLTGGTGQAGKVPDTRVSYAGHDAAHLPPGPYQLTNANYPYDAYAASPVHRFFQMWQQLDCDAAAVDRLNGFGCMNDLFPWVEVSVGAGSNGKGQPSGFTNTTTGEGSTSMGFFNMLQGDAPYLKELADTFTLADNYHQGVQGGTGSNHFMLGYADVLWYSDGNGNPLVPPSNPVDPRNPGTPPNGVSALSEIENPNPQPGTNNYYIEDGYGGGSGSPTAVAPHANYGGGSYVNCADPAQPGVPAVLTYLNALPNPVPSRCDAGHYYLLNNYNPGYFGDGSNAYTDTNSNNYVYTIPPTKVRHVGDALNDKKISWAYYGDQWNLYVNDKYQMNPADAYCNICNWAQFSTSIMTNPAQRAAHLKDTTDLYAALQSGNLPAVSYVKPSGLVDGHPASSKLNLYEGFVKKIVDLAKANPELRNDTAIFVTFDEGGGYWDSGYVQPVDFFGDGTRIPMIVVSKYSQGGHVSHSYTDHASIIKFIEANWGLAPLTNRSRDNLPNPLTDGNPYIPVNAPAIGDMMDMFNFDR